jgi:acyl dehydratase
MPIAGYTMSTVREFIGRELGVSGWRTIDQDRIDAFARCTDDHQWIHVDVERAKRDGPFGGTIAHGYLTLAMLSPLQNEIGIIPADAKQAINVGLDKLRFLAPVKAGARLRMHATLLEVEDRGKGRLLLRTQNTIDIEGEEKPALTVESLALIS